ncbi:hypothetical protein GF382_03455 [Candidatus Falkowbacteria bacterium]|nr:hypothetical protein [Candidatus Falkowbacteria bacterium]
MKEKSGKRTVRVGELAWSFFNKLPIYLNLSPEDGYEDDEQEKRIEKIASDFSEAMTNIKPMIDDPANKIPGRVFKQSGNITLKEAFEIVEDMRKEFRLREYKENNEETRRFLSEMGDYNKMMSKFCKAISFCSREIEIDKDLWQKIQTALKAKGLA